MPQGVLNIVKFQANLGESGGILTLLCAFIILNYNTAPRNRPSQKETSDYPFEKGLC